MIRTGYSFRVAVGQVSQVAERLRDIGWTSAPIADRGGTFGFVSWTKACEAAKIRPVYGIELAVSDNWGEKRPRYDWWVFLAKERLRDLNQLVKTATSSSGKVPVLSYQQALDAPGVIRIAQEHCDMEACDFDLADTYMGITPATPRATIKAAEARGAWLIAHPRNVYPLAGDLELYRVMLGRYLASTQTYPQHILSDDELSACIRLSSFDEAVARRRSVLDECRAVLETAELLKVNATDSLQTLCVRGAIALGVDLCDGVYAERLERELRLIAEKKFDDYFHIIAELVAWAKPRMVVGPARGSSCGSLVCYLLGITAIDPIPHGLIFERFIDVTRTDLPDIDLDFSDAHRDAVFAHAEQRYGERVARLASVAIFQPRSTLARMGAALKIPTWQVNEVAETAIKRAMGDSRKSSTIEDTLTTTDAGKKMLNEFPEAIIASRFEGHPDHSGIHAAGLVVTDSPVIDYVAVDMRSRTAMCNKYDAEHLNLLKIDVLGLTQLSIFERILELIGQEPISGWLEKIPLDDPAAFEVLNRHKYCGIFQFEATAMRALSRQVTFESLEDIIAVTALVRPGPLASGSTAAWIERREGRAEVTYAHPLLEEYLRDTFGVPVYQEQILRIGREIGDLSWADVTALRKAMSKSLGAEYFSQYGDRWKSAAVVKGMPPEVADKFWDELCQYGAWCLSGDTKLINPHPSQYGNKTFTLRELYESNGFTPRKGTSKDPRQSKKRQKLLCLQDGAIKPAANVMVTHSGKRETWLVEVDSGEKIRATMDHKFLCVDGVYRPLKQLESGSALAMMGERRLTSRKEKKGIGRGGQNWWPKLKAGEPLYKRQVEKLRRVYKRCQVCKQAPYQDTHHVNFDHTDHSWENLLPVCKKCHKALHGGASIGNSIGKQVRIAHIVSISEPRIEDVYDVSMPAPHHNFVAEGFVVHNCFNRAHSVSYAYVSYWCAWLKAHHPVEFAAATLDSGAEPEKQIKLLRELADEGIGYVAVDPDESTNRWTVRSDGSLLGPLTNIKGIGPAKLAHIIQIREANRELSAAQIRTLMPAGLKKMLDDPKTDIDSLYPIRDRLKKLYPKGLEEHVVSSVTPVVDCQPGLTGERVIIITPTRITPKDENEPVKVAKRGYKLSAPTQALNMFVRDDGDEMFAKVGRYRYKDIGLEVQNEGQPGKVIWAMKGVVPETFRMLDVYKVKKLGYLE